jgi:hypothetical protein
MAQQGLTKIALAARMHVNGKAVRVRLSGREVSLNRTLDALRAMGIRPALAIRAHWLSPAPDSGFRHELAGHAGR